MRSSDHGSENITNSRIGAKGWFLTYPKCQASKEDLIKAFATFSPHPTEEYIVARELHEDGSPHLHAFVKFSEKVWLDKKVTRFDFQGYHGNYQVAKCWKAVQDYCRKGSDYVTKNIDVLSALQKKAKRSVDILTRTDVKSLITDGTVHALQLPQVMKSRSIYRFLEKPEDQKDVRGVWVYGKPGVGKSHYVRAKEPELFIKSQNKWWDGYEGQPAVLIDDFDEKGVCLDHYLKIWSDKWGTTGEVKGGTVNLDYQTLYVTSNFTIEHLFRESEPDTIKAIKRRFKVIHMLDRKLDLMLPSRSRSRSREKPRRSNSASHN